VKVEEEEGRGGAEFLALKEHRRAGDEQQEGGHGTEPARGSQFIQAIAAGRVGELVVVLDVVDETGGRDADGR